MASVGRAVAAAVVAIVVIFGWAATAGAGTQETYPPPRDVESECTTDCGEVLVQHPASDPPTTQVLAQDPPAPPSAQPLAFTGSNSVAYTAVALAIIAAGTALVLASRFQLVRVRARVDDAD